MPLISDSIGRVLGKRYRLLSALGTGASAHVFLAEDVSLQRHVAVKVLQPGLATDEAFLKRFRAEARSVASLNHPHVLRVFDWGEDTDGPYLVLEYLGGGSLRDLLDRDVRLSHSQAAQLGTEVAQGLAYAHARGLVHRDIKPANLLVRRGGPGAGGRLRRGPRPGRGGLDRAGGRDGGHGPLHLARGGRGQARRRPGRRLLAGAGPLRGGDGHGALRHRHDDGHAGGAASGSRCRTTPRWGRSTTCWPAPRRPRSPPGSTPPGWRPGWARWRRRCRRRLRCRSSSRTSRPRHRSRVPRPRRVRADRVGGGRGAAPRADLDGDRAAASGPAAPPVGTKAGPGEIFDAEPFGHGPAAAAAGRPHRSPSEPGRRRRAHVVDRRRRSPWR